jgi:hypothetical protein
VKKALASNTTYQVIVQRFSNGLAVDQGVLTVETEVFLLLPADADPDRWNQVRRMAATTFAAALLHMASGIEPAKLAVLFSAEEILGLDLASGLSVQDMVAALATTGPDEWSEGLHMFRIEIHIVQEEFRRDEPVESVGGIFEAPPGDDVGLRQGSVDALAQEVGTTFGDDSLPDDNAKAREESKVKYPRVAPPEVEDEVGQAVREDSPGHIARAFPKLFPYGAGDFRDMCRYFPKLLNFEEWDRFVMMWHDGRFVRRSRFRC